MSDGKQQTARQRSLLSDPENALTGPLRFVLLIPWLLFRPLVWLRNALFNWGIRRSRRLPAPVISVGNIAVGGTGKTPVVDLCCQLLADSGYQPAVLSRGYRATNADGSNDEARMLAWPVVCNSKRFDGGQQALNTGANALVLDDGFQHRQLHRNLDLVCIDATRPWGRRDGRRGRTLPLGLLREHPSALSRADVAIVTRSDQVSTERLDHIRRSLTRMVPVVLCASHQPTLLTDLDGAEKGPPTELAGQAIQAVCGIGNPAAFTKTLQQLGAEIISDHHFADHHHYVAAEVDELLSDPTAKLVVTAKDAVKIRELKLVHRERISVLHVRCALAGTDHEQLKQLLQQATMQTDDPGANAS